MVLFIIIVSIIVIIIINMIGQLRLPIRCYGVVAVVFWCTEGLRTFYILFTFRCTEGLRTFETTEAQKVLIPVPKT